MLKLLAGTLVGCCLIVGSMAGTVSAKEWTVESVVQRLKTTPINLEEQRRDVVNDDEPPPPPKERLAWRINSFVKRELMFVAAADAAIESPLEAMLDPSNDFTRRCRAMFGLVRRGNRQGLAAAAKLLRSDDELDRITGWAALFDAPNLRAIYPIVAQDEIASLYRDEKVGKVLGAAESFFGKHRAKFAVAELSRRATVELDPDRSESIVLALTLIGDPAAVATITTARADDNWKVWALGRLADPAGAPFLAEHLESPEAVIYLARCKGPIAHAAIKSRADGTQPIDIPERNKHDPEFLNEYREHLLIAQTLVESKSPRRELFDIARNSDHPERLRLLALQELQILGPGQLVAEFLTFYRSQMQTDLGAHCIDVVNDVSTAEVTAAMIEHLKQLHSLRDAPEEKSKLSGKPLQIAEDVVFLRLHKRIGNRAFDY